MNPIRKGLSGVLVPLITRVPVLAEPLDVDQVEKETGLDFLRELPDPIEELLEHIEWEMLPNI